MQGIHIINDANGQPAVLTIDLHNLDPDISPLVDALLGHITNEPADSSGYKCAPGFNDERQEFIQASMMNLNRAYGDETDYDETDLLERNPDYRPITDNN